MDLAQRKLIIKCYPKDAMHQFKVAPVPVQLRVPKAQENRLSLINLLAKLEDDLAQEYNALMDQPEVTVTVPPPTTVVAPTPLHEGITVTKLTPVSNGKMIR